MLIKVKVFPGSKRASVKEVDYGHFEVRVKEEPERNEANKAVLKLLAKYFRTTEKKFRIVKGTRSRNKIISLGKAF